MKRLLIGVALCLLPVWAGAAQCRTNKIFCAESQIPGEPNKLANCYENIGGQDTVCELPREYYDKDGRTYEDKDSGYMVLPPKDGHKQPDDGKGDKKPESGKDPKQPSTGAKCYSYSIEGGVCKRGGWRYTVITPGIGNGYLCSDTFSPRVETPCPKEEKPKQPEQPKPNDGKTDKGHDQGDGKQPKDDGNSKGDKGDDNGDGKGDKGDGNGNGKGDKGDGNGKGDKGDSEGKGMFKGGAGSGHLGEVRVPKSRDGIGWKGDFFLRNPNQCPQDKSMSVLGRSIVFSYSKVCYFLDMLSPVIKAVFMFVAGLMVVKSIRAK